MKDLPCLKSTIWNMPKARIGDGDIGNKNERRDDLWLKSNG